MNQEQRNLIGEIWTHLATNYRRDATRGSIRLLINGVQDLPFEQVRHVLENWMGSKHAKDFPLPYHVREAIQPSMDDETRALLAASKVIAAVPKYGWAQGHLARADIGELGWIAVQRLGGWQYLCENLGVDLSITTVQAQVRDMLRAESKATRMGMSDQPIGLPSREEAKAFIDSLPKPALQGSISENKSGE